MADCRRPLGPLARAPQRAGAASLTTRPPASRASFPGSIGKTACGFPPRPTPPRGRAGPRPPAYATARDVRAAARRRSRSRSRRGRVGVRPLTASRNSTSSRDSSARLEPEISASTASSPQRNTSDFTIAPTWSPTAAAASGAVRAESGSTRARPPRHGRGGRPGSDRPGLMVGRVREAQDGRWVPRVRPC